MSTLPAATTKSGSDSGAIRVRSELAMKESVRSAAATGDDEEAAGNRDDRERRTGNTIQSPIEARAASEGSRKRTTSWTRWKTILIELRKSN